MAINLMTLYKELYNELVQIYKDEANCKSQLLYIKKDTQRKIDLLDVDCQKKIEEIDKDLDDISILESTAKQYASIGGYRPSAKRYSLQELQQLYVMIAPDSTASQYALRLLQCCSDMREYFKNEKKKLVQAKNIQTRALIDSVTNGSDATKNQNELTRIAQRIRELIHGKKMEVFAQELKTRSSAFVVKTNQEYNISFPIYQQDIFCYGMAAMPFPARDEFSKDLKYILGNYYIQQDKTVLLPISTYSNRNDNGEYAASAVVVLFNNQTSTKVYNLTQGILFNIMRSYAPMARRVVYIDTETYNDEHLGCMKYFCGNNSMVLVPRDSNEAISMLKKLEDDILSEPVASRERRFLVVRGVSTSTQHSLCSSILKLNNNAKKYNLSLILLERDLENRNTLDSLALQLNPQLFVRANDDAFYFRLGNKNVRFYWHANPQGITQNTIQFFNSELEPKPIDNLYEKYFPLSQQKEYTRTRGGISINYGINSTGEIQNFEIENENFAAFIMGAPGAGKSYLFHIILLELIRNYHPDEVELWLADFGKVGFENYIEHMPPHIRYVLMDNSSDTIKDFIDLMLSELTRREAILAAYKCDDRINLPKRVYLPAIIVLIDEFSALSDTIKNDRYGELYKDHLFQLLVRGRKCGFRFLFANQFFTKGENAISSVKDLIKVRFAMMADANEIRATLDLPAIWNTERLSNAIATLPAHHVIQRQYDPNASYKVTESQVLFIPSKTPEHWSSRYAMFDMLNDHMEAIDQENYSESIVDQYVKKDPVVIKKNDLQVFTLDSFQTQLGEWKKNNADSIFDDDFFIQYGKPRMLRPYFASQISPEKGENILLVYNDTEIDCCMSIIRTIANTFATQGGSVHIWTNTRNRIYNKYKAKGFDGFNVAYGICEVKQDMDALIRKYREGICGKDLIITLGLENLLREINDSDEFGASSYNSQQSTNWSVLQAKTDAEVAEAKENDAFNRFLAENQDRLYDQWEQEGLSDEQMAERWDAWVEPYYNTKYGNDSHSIMSKKESLLDVDDQTSKQVFNEINYMDAFQTMLRSGSKYGYHFAVCINNIAALHEIGAISCFNHRLSFRTDTNDTSMIIFGDSRTRELELHSCRYASFGPNNEGFTFDPFLHQNITWDNWDVTTDNKAINRAITTELYK